MWLNLFKIHLKLAAYTAYIAFTVDGMLLLAVRILLSKFLIWFPLDNYKINITIGFEK